ncbi:dynein beta chain, ciliary [Trichonephila clavipes]|nr:dynein beta chain, ciliary [Trichonephila clavipes]
MHDDDVMSMMGPNQTVPWTQMTVLAFCVILTTQKFVDENRALFLVEKQEQLDCQKRIERGSGVTENIKSPSTKSGFKSQAGSYKEYERGNSQALESFQTPRCGVCRITRILESGGNALLVGVGGSGRQSSASLAAYICNLHLHQPTLHSEYDIQDFKNKPKEPRTWNHYKPKKRNIARVEKTIVVSRAVTGLGQ